jgi:DNA repair exonuclease SbcCD ATPase subunit
MTELKLYIENIGGLKGTNDFILYKNSLNIIGGINGSGKSSIAKALMLIYGINKKLQQENSGIFKMEAVNLGLLPELGNFRSGIIHAEAEYGKVKLIDDQLEKEIIIRKNGNIEINFEGNEEFLVTSVLTPNSWIYQAISKPMEIKSESIFSHYISKLNFKIDKLNEAKEIIKNKIEELNQKLIEVKEKKAEIPNLKKDINALNNEINEFNMRKEKLLESINSQSNKDKNYILKIKNEIFELNNEKKEIQRRINQHNIALNKLKSVLIEKENELKNIEKEINNLKTNKKILEEELNKLNTKEEYKKLIDDLNIEIAYLKGRANIYDSVSDVLKQEDEVICPVCGIGKINKTKVNEELEIIKKEITEKDKKRFELIEKINKIDSIKNNIDKIESDIKKKEQNNNISLSIKKTENEYLNEEKSLKEDLTILEKINEKIKNLENILSKERPELLDELNNLNRLLDKKNNELQEKESKLVISGYIQIYDKKIDLDKAIKDIQLMINALKNSEKYIENEIEKIKYEIIDEFNNLIKNVLKSLNMSEFKKIYLNNNYILNVQYITSNKEVKVLQPYALSESERVIIGIIFILALNKIYSNNNKVIIIDNMYEFLDPSREKQIFDLLEDYSSKNNVTIIITKTSNDNTLNIKPYKEVNKNG